MGGAESKSLMRGRHAWSAIPSAREMACLEAARPPTDAHGGAVFSASDANTSTSGPRGAWPREVGGVRRVSSSLLTAKAKELWEQHISAGHEVNPCNSPRHPAALAGIPLNEGEVHKSIQEAYDAHSLCFVCGNAHPDGLNLRSYRAEDEVRHTSALRSRVAISDNYQGLPGIVSTGILDSLMICHGSWQAGIALMDKAILPRPPLTLTKSFSVEIVDRLPPGMEVEINTDAIHISDKREPYEVKVCMELRVAREAGEGTDAGPVFARGEAVYTKVGAVRSMW